MEDEWEREQECRTLQRDDCYGAISSSLSDSLLSVTLNAIS